YLFFFQAEDGIRDPLVTGVQTCALPISVIRAGARSSREAPYTSVDLPEPLSPARPTTSPGARLRFTLSTARTSPPGVRYTTDRSLMSSTGSWPGRCDVATGIGAWPGLAVIGPALPRYRQAASCGRTSAGSRPAGRGAARRR